MTEPLIYDLSSPGRKGIQMPAPDVPLAELPQHFVVLLVRRDWVWVAGHRGCSVVPWLCG